MNLFTYARFLLIGIIAGMLSTSPAEFALISLALTGATAILIDIVERAIDGEIRGIFG